LTAQQVEAILAHELAHIRRHDYLVNLLQTLVETVLFYHPAVWWLSRRIPIAATGGSLLLRVRRLLGAPSSHSGRGPAWLAALAALSLIGCVAYSADDRQAAHRQRIVQAREFNARQLRDLGRTIRAELRSDLRSARVPLRY